MKNNRCRLCDNDLKELIRYENTPKGAYSFNDTEGITLPVARCLACGLVQIPLRPVDYYKKAIRSTAWINNEWRKVQIADFKNRFGGTNIKVINEEPKPEKYDAFFMFNYLEHFPEPKKTLLQIRDNLPDNGVGIIEVPNWDMIAKEGLFSEIVIDHLAYYTKDTLNALLTMSGFEVIENNYYLDNYILSATVRKKNHLDSMDLFLEKEKQIVKTIDEYIDKFHNVAIWGAGHQTLFILPRLRNRPCFIIDTSKKKQGNKTAISNIKILDPETLKILHVDAIIVSVGGFYYEIEEQIKKLDLGYEPDLVYINKTRLEKL